MTLVWPLQFIINNASENEKDNKSYSVKKRFLKCINRSHYLIIHSFCSLSYDRSVASSKASSPQGAI
jgi:hypothetical protein